MSNNQKWAVIVGLFFVGLIGGLVAQQQYSGGQSVTVSNASLPVTESGTWTVQPGNTANTTAWKVDGSAVTQPVSMAGLPALAAGTAKVGITYPWTGCGTTLFETGSPAGLAAMPTSSTAVAAATTCALTIIVSNTTGGALTYTISDNAGTPINFLNAVTINGGERNEYTFSNGMKFNAGIKVTSSGAGLTYYIAGLQ